MVTHGKNRFYGNAVHSFYARAEKDFHTVSNLTRKGFGSHYTLEFLREFFATREICLKVTICVIVTLDFTSTKFTLKIFTSWKFASRKFTIRIQDKNLTLSSLLLGPICISLQFEAQRYSGIAQEYLYSLRRLKVEGHDVLGLAPCAFCKRLVLASSNL